MALDSIKPTKNNHHKTFPFTSPITNKNPPTGTVILEIIFSADDVSSPAVTKEGGGDDEEEVDGNDDSDEDDIDGASNSDTHSHHSNSEDESEDEESDEAEEEDDEDDDEDGEEVDEEESDEDDEEREVEDEAFANEFDDNDFIIDFGNGGDNEEDQLVVEFEDSNSPPASPRPSSPKPAASTTPFWFTHEEPDQIRMIFESYGETLNLEEQRKACVRSPAPFIGRIQRTPIKATEADTDTSFKTLDKVEIYLRELYPLGTMLPLSRVAWVLTTWDANDGVPTNSYELPKSAKSKHPSPRGNPNNIIETMQKRAQGNSSSTLYCNPVFRTKEEYQYTVAPQDHPLMYTSNSSTNASISRISPFLPEHCRTISFSLD